MFFKPIRKSLYLFLLIAVVVLVLGGSGALPVTATISCSSPTVITGGGSFAVSTSGTCFKYVNSTFTLGGMVSVMNGSSSTVSNSVGWYGGTAQTVTSCTNQTSTLTGNGAQLNNFVVAKDSTNAMYLTITGNVANTVSISIQNWQNGTGCSVKPTPVSASGGTTVTSAPTKTNTPASSTNTPTTAPTKTNTPISATNTATFIPPTSTKTNTPLVTSTTGATSTRTNTPLPTATAVATSTRAFTSTPIPTIAVTATPATPVVTGLNVQIKNSGSDNNQETAFNYLVKNTGSSAQANISVRIYFTLDGGNAASSYTLEKYSDTSGVATIAGPTLASGSIYYFTVSYGTASLAAGGQWEYVTALHLNNWATTFNGTNDWYHTGYAVGALPSNYTNTNDIPAYVSGVLTWGSEPGSSSSGPTSTAGPSSTPIPSTPEVVPVLPTTPLNTSPGNPVTGNATWFSGIGGTSYGGCGIPQANLDTQNFLAMNVQNTPLDYTTMFTRPIAAQYASKIGMFDNGMNCGRWVKVTIGNYCTGINDGAQNMPFCHGGSWITDAYNGATLDMVVADSCQDPNAWCRDDPYHVDLNEPSLNLFMLNGQPVGNMNPDHWNNRQVSWQFESAPNYTGDINIGFIQNAQAYWTPIAITHLPNGIHGVDYYQNGAWYEATMDSDMGEDYLIGATAGTGGSTYQIRVWDANNQLLNNGRIYNFSFPTSCGSSCSAMYTQVTYTTQ